MLWGPVGLILSTPLTLCVILLGRYVPQLTFLEIILGDAPVLSPYANFYQRLLALDDDEARKIAVEYLKDHALDELYDSVLIPALGLAEKDRHTNTLDDSRSAFIYRGTSELVEELYEMSQEGTQSTLCEISPVSDFSSPRPNDCLYFQPGTKPTRLWEPWLRSCSGGWDISPKSRDRASRNHVGTTGDPEPRGSLRFCLAALCGWSGKVTL